MATEHAPVNVQLIHHHIFQVGKQLLPLCMMGQDTGMQHVGIGHHDMALLADGLPGVIRGVSPS